MDGSLFRPEDVISAYTDANAVDDSILVAVSSADRVTRTVWEWLCKYTPMNSQSPNCWPVEMMGWFRASKISKEEALKLIAEHGKDEAQKVFDRIIRDRRAKALASGILARNSRLARKVYDENIDGGIFTLYAKVAAIGNGPAEFVDLATTPNGGNRLWLMPNECGGMTLMFPEDY